METINRSEIVDLLQVYFSDRIYGFWVASEKQKKQVKAQNRVFHQIFTIGRFVR